jgi:MFS family permease
MRALLRHRDARLYLVGQVASLFGDSALWLAIAIWIRVLTGSFAAAGLSWFALAVGSLFGPLGGLLADRFRRRPLLVATNLATAGLVLLLLLVRDRHQVWLMYLVMFGYGVSGSLLGPAQTALVQGIVPADLLGDANGALQTAQQGMRLVTPLAGAGLFAVVGPVPVIVGDAATFLVAVATLLALGIKEARVAQPGRHWFAEMTSGARHIARTIPLRQLTVTACIVVTAYGLSESIPFAVVSRGLHRSAPFVGVLTAAQGVGAIIAGLAAGPLMRRLSEATLAVLGMVSAGAGFLLLIPGNLPAVLAGSALLGASLSWIIAGIMTLFQRRTPPELMGRTDAAFTFGYAIPQTVAIAVGAGLIATLSYRLLLLIIAAIMTLAAGYLATRSEQPRTTHAPAGASRLPWWRRRVRTCAGVHDKTPEGDMTDPQAGDSLGDVFDAHLDAEFEARDLDAVMATMADDPYLVHVPVLTGGVGWGEVRDFYGNVFIGHWPQDTVAHRVSRTIGDDQVVDELVMSFTHDVEIGALLPGVAPTGRAVRLPVCVVAGFAGGKLSHEHIYWDQASLLVQVGLLDRAGLPVTGGEQAESLLSPRTVQANALLGKRWQPGSTG